MDEKVPKVPEPLDPLHFSADYENLVTFFLTLIFTVHTYDGTAAVITGKNLPLQVPFSSVGQK